MQQTNGVDNTIGIETGVLVFGIFFIYCEGQRPRPAFWKMESIAALPPSEGTRDCLMMQHQKMLGRRRTNLALGIVTLLVSTKMVVM